MGAVAFRKNAYDNATAGQKAMLNLILTKFDLGEPRIFEDGGGVEHYVFYDSRFNPREAVQLIAAAESLPDLNLQYGVLDNEDQWAAASAITPAWMKVGESVPAGWVDPTLPPPEVTEEP